MHALYNNKKNDIDSVKSKTQNDIQENAAIISKNKSHQELDAVQLTNQIRDGIRQNKFNGVNIFGFIDSESGVGEAARTLIRAVASVHIPFALINSDQAPHRRKETQFSKKFGDINPYLVNLIAIYGDMFGSELDRFGKEKFKNHHNIAYWAWELSTLPIKWASLLDNVNEVWTPSQFSAHAIQKARRDIDITVIPHAIEIQKCPYGRSRFNLPENIFLFLFMFDFYSIFERKNPLAIVRAFKNAFQEDEPVGLIIKCSNSHIDPENFRKLEKEIIEVKPRYIKIIPQYLEREEISSLINVCDCYVSLHRSEGFGLSIAEAMALRKPVIATHYSGNTDFMNEENSFPVPYTLIPLAHDYGTYTKGNVWAEPDENEAVKYMRLVFEQREIAARKGMLAQRYIMEHLSPQSVATLIQKRLKKIFYDEI